MEKPINELIYKKITWTDRQADRWTEIWDHLILKRGKYKNSEPNFFRIQHFLLVWDKVAKSAILCQIRKCTLLREFPLYPIKQESTLYFFFTIYKKVIFTFHKLLKNVILRIYWCFLTELQSVSVGVTFVRTSHVVSQST